MRLVDGQGLVRGMSKARRAKIEPIVSQDAYPGCRDLEAYWHALRGAAIVPKRTDFDPRGVERSLTHTFVAERVAASVVRVRVAGSHLGDLLGMDVRGMPITSFIDPDSRDMLGTACRRLFDGPEKLVLDLHSPVQLGQRALQGRMALLPMSDGLGQITRVVGCLETRGREGRWPRRFGITHLRTVALDGAAPEPIWQNVPDYPLPSARQLHACAEDPPVAFRSNRPADENSNRTTVPLPQSAPNLRRSHQDVIRLVVDNG